MHGKICIEINTWRWVDDENKVNLNEENLQIWFQNEVPILIL